MSIFLGFGLGSIFIPRFGEWYGRRWPLFVSVVVQFLSCLGMSLVPGGKEENAYWLVALCFPMGFFAAGTSAIGCSYMTEFGRLAWTPYITAIFNSSEGLIYIYLTLFYWHHKEVEYQFYF